MTDEIRREVRAALARKGWTQTELAEQLGVKRQYVSLMLTGERGKLPHEWKRMLDLLGLELKVGEKE